MMDQWSLQNDPMADDGYGFIPLLIVGAALGIGGGYMAAEAYQTSQEVTDLDEMRAMVRTELSKLDDGLDQPNGDIIRTSFMNGPASSREAWIQAAFWLARASRVALGAGRDLEAEDLGRRAQEYLGASSRVGDNQNRAAMVKPLRDAQSLIFPVSYTISNTLERLSGREAIAMRQSYRQAYDFSEMITRPLVQTGKDVGELATAPFDAIVWLKDNAKFIVAGIVGLVVVNSLVAGRAARKSASRASSKRESQPKRRYAT